MKTVIEWEVVNETGAVENEAECKTDQLRGIKDWVQGFWGYIMAKFESILWQMKKLKVIV